MTEDEQSSRWKKIGNVRGGVRKDVKSGFQKMKRISVDLSNRLQRSFGNPVKQQVEIHYQGKPMTFNYLGPLESTSIDVIRQKEGIKDKEELEVKFDPTKRRMDTSKVTVQCSCGQMFTVDMDTVKTTSDKAMIREATRKNHSILTEHYEKEGHTLSVKVVETPVEYVRENERIKNFTDSRINYFRMFSKKTAEVKYLVSYGQDLLSEAPQYPYNQTTAGEHSISNQNFLFFLFIFGLIELFTYLASSSSSASYYSPVVHPSFTPWYAVIVVAIGMLIVMWRLHIRDLARTMVKVIMLQSAPFYISNRGVLPVVMVNSVVNQVWDYQARMMDVDEREAKDVFYSLQAWSDAQISELYAANKLGQVEKELSTIANSIRSLEKVDYEYRRESEQPSSNLKGMILAVVATVVGYSLVLFILGIF